MQDAATEWKNLTEEKKKYYLDIAKEKHLKYKKEMGAFLSAGGEVPKKKAKKKKSISNAETKDTEAEVPDEDSPKKKKKSEPKVKGHFNKAPPPTAAFHIFFSAFLEENRQKLSKHSRADNEARAKKMWEAME